MVETHCCVLLIDEWASYKQNYVSTSCLLCNSTRTAELERGQGGWTVWWKRRRVEARQGGGSEAGEERGSAVDRTKDERKEGGS